MHGVFRARCARTYTRARATGVSEVISVGRWLFRASAKRSGPCPV